VSWYQKGKTNLDLLEQEISELQWHLLGKSAPHPPQTDNHTNIPPLRFFTGHMPFLLPNQQRQSTEDIRIILIGPL